MSARLHEHDRRSDPEPAAAAWLDELGDPFREVGGDREGRVSTDWGVSGVSVTFVFGLDSRIRHKFVGPLQPRDVEETLLPLLADLAG